MLELLCIKSTCTLPSTPIQTMCATNDAALSFDFLRTLVSIILLPLAYTWIPWSSGRRIMSLMISLEITWIISMTFLLDDIYEITDQKISAWYYLGLVLTYTTALLVSRSAYTYTAYDITYDFLAAQSAGSSKRRSRKRY